MGIFSDAGGNSRKVEVEITKHDVCVDKAKDTSFIQFTGTDENGREYEWRQYISDKNYWAVERTFEAIGFQGQKVTQLAPAHPDFQDCSGNSVTLKSKMNGQYENWEIDFPKKGSNAVSASSDDLSSLEAKFSHKVYQPGAPF
tara:strand:- start:7570 stop:7998 length:429 start_codon:yes stop_codon:yes gene_type:complete